MTRPDVYDHFRATDAGVPDGIYRVVGSDDGSVTLLRVGDPDGSRVHTGEVVTVDSETVERLAPAENPDGNESLAAAVASAVRTGYWSLRAFAEQLAANPVPAAVATIFLLAGTVGDRIVTLPDVAFSALTFVGIVGLALVGGGRL